MLPFAVQASQGCSTPCHLALALAAEFAPVHTARAEDALDELALCSSASRTASRSTSSMPSPI